MVFVKVRETYDLHTVKNKMTVIGIHTPKPGIIKANFPGLLAQCRAYRPVKCDVRVACASVLPLDPQGVGLGTGDVAPEDVFNPILYKAMSNKGMSMLEARIQAMVENGVSPGVDLQGNSAYADFDSVTTKDNFAVYYSILSNAHDWKKANPQSGLMMKGLRPLVYEMNYNIGDVGGTNTLGYTNGLPGAPDADGNKETIPIRGVLGRAKPFPYLNCTSYSIHDAGSKTATDFAQSCFPGAPGNCSIDVPYMRVLCGAILIPPSRLHELFYRMVVEWTIEFTKIRPIGEVTDFADQVSIIAPNTHYINYSYESTKNALTGTDDSILDNDSDMVSSNVGIERVM